MIERDRLACAIESLLFVAGEPAQEHEVRRALEADEESFADALQRLEASLSSRGIRLQRLNGLLQLATAPEFSAYIERFLGLQRSARLSAAALEALSIIAYRQPITRQHVEMIRGVNSDGVIGTLVSRGLIEEVGRAEAVGRPILYGTTFLFLQHFGLSSPADLPPLPEP